jgi:hypothetical protein
VKEELRQAVVQQVRLAQELLFTRRAGLQGDLAPPMLCAFCMG